MSKSGTYQLKLWVEEQKKKKKNELESARNIFTAPGTLRLEPIKKPNGQERKLKIHGAPEYLQLKVDEFIESCLSGDHEAVDQFIRSGIPINSRHSLLGYTALHAAAGLRNPSIIKALIRGGADVQILNKHSQTSLHTAAKYGNKSSVRQLLAAGADKKDARDIAHEFRHFETELLLMDLPPPPHSVVITNVTPYSFSIHWEIESTSENLPDYNSDPRQKKTTSLETELDANFMVEWKENTKVLSKLTSQRSLQIEALLPATTYQVTVKAANQAGWGPKSLVVTVQTEDHIPAVPHAPVVMNVTENKVSIRLKLPSCHGTPIRQVSIQVQCKGSLVECTANLAGMLVVNPNDEDWRNQWVGDISCLKADESGLHHYTAQGLLAGHVYFFRFATRNAIGWSEFSIPCDGLCTNDCPKVVEKGSSFMSLVWPKPFTTKHIDMYELQYRQMSSSIQWSVVRSDIVEPSVVVQHLTPATGYIFRVRPHYQWEDWESYDISAESEVSFTKIAVPDAPFAIEMFKCTCFDLWFRWQKPCCNGSSILCYELQIAQIGTEWTVLDSNLSPACDEYHVTKLEKGTAYQFRIRCKNDEGWSPFGTLAEPVSTHDILPPETPILKSRNHHSITIEWSIPDDSNIAYYELQVAHKDDSWLTVAPTLPDREFVCGRLRPLAWHRFRVRAFSPSRGWGAFCEPSAPIQTSRRM